MLEFPLALGANPAISSKPAFNGHVHNYMHTQESLEPMNVTFSCLLNTLQYLGPVELENCWLRDQTASERHLQAPLACLSVAEHNNTQSRCTHGRQSGCDSRTHSLVLPNISAFIFSCWSFICSGSLCPVRSVCVCVCGGEGWRKYVDCPSTTPCGCM